MGAATGAGVGVGCGASVPRQDSRLEIQAKEKQTGAETAEATW